MMSKTPGRVQCRGVALVTALAFVSACGGAGETAPGQAGAEEAAEELPPGYQLSALAPENLAKERPEPPFDLTGNWFIDTKDGADPEAWRFGPPYPTLTPAAQVHFDASAKAAAGPVSSGPPHAETSASAVTNVTPRQHRTHPGLFDIIVPLPYSELPPSRAGFS